jgi:hypothetical protein
VATISVIEQPTVKAARNQAVTIPVGAGETTVVNLTVTAEDGTQHLYRVQVSRDALPPVPQKPPEQAPAGQNAPQQSQSQQNQSPQSQSQQNPAAAADAAARTPEKPALLASHILVSVKDLRMPDAIRAELSAKSEAVAGQARITLRYYRTDAVLQQGTAHVDTRLQGGNTTLSIDYKSADVALDRRNLVEIEVAIPTSLDRVLYYTEARPADDEMRIEPSFLLLGKNSRAAWPAMGSPVQVASYYSTAREDKDQPAAPAVLEISDPATGKVLARQGVGSRGHWRQGALVAFSQPLVLPEGATVRYSLLGQAKGGAGWQSTGTAQVWTVGIDPQGGPGQAVLFGIDDRPPVKQKKD